MNATDINFENAPLLFDVKIKIIWSNSLTITAKIKSLI